MALVSEKVELVAFQFGGASSYASFASNARIFEVGKIKYEFIEVREENQLVDGEHDDDILWIELHFDVYLNYLGSMVNKGATYDVPGEGTDVSSQSNADWITIANRLVSGLATTFFPRFKMADGSHDYTNGYEVVSRNSNTSFIESARAGFFDPAIPLKMKAKTPLSSYPSWAEYTL